MSTRGCYRFTDGRETFTVYKHSDNYPDGKHGGIEAIAAAQGFAWPLPRFEADEFAAAFVAAHKFDMRWHYGPQGAGGAVRLLNTPDGHTLEHMPSDIEYLYDVSLRNEELWVRVSEIVRPKGWSSGEIEAQTIAEGTLAEMRQHFKENR